MQAVKPPWSLFFIPYRYIKEAYAADIEPTQYVTEIIFTQLE